jgi:hypothetical protein
VKEPLSDTDTDSWSQFEERIWNNPPALTEKELSDPTRVGHVCTSKATEKNSCTPHDCATEEKANGFVGWIKRPDNIRGHGACFWIDLDSFARLGGKWLVCSLADYKPIYV